jgi:hypothetical protein
MTIIVWKCLHTGARIASTASGTIAGLSISDTKYENWRPFLHRNPIYFYVLDQAKYRGAGRETQIGLRVQLEPPGASDVSATKIALAVIANDCDFQYQSM